MVSAMAPMLQHGDVPWRKRWHFVLNHQVAVCLFVQTNMKLSRWWMYNLSLTSNKWRPKLSLASIFIERLGVIGAIHFLWINAYNENTQVLLFWAPDKKKHIKPIISCQSGSFQPLKMFPFISKEWQAPETRKAAWNPLLIRGGSARRSCILAKSRWVLIQFSRWVNMAQR